jgi:hypothetical protein
MITMVIILIIIIPVKRTDITAVGIRRSDHATLFYPLKLTLPHSTNYADKRRPLGRYTSLTG